MQILKQKISKKNNDVPSETSACNLRFFLSKCFLHARCHSRRHLQQSIHLLQQAKKDFKVLAHCAKKHKIRIIFLNTSVQAFQTHPCYCQAQIQIVPQTRPFRAPSQAFFDLSTKRLSNNQLSSNFVYSSLNKNTSASFPCIEIRHWGHW